MPFLGDRNGLRTLHHLDHLLGLQHLHGVIVQLQLPFQIKYPPVHRVLHKDGRFYVIRPVAGTNGVYDVVENCRALRFATEVCDALNEGRRK